MTDNQTADAVDLARLIHILSEEFDQEQLLLFCQGLAVDCTFLLKLAVNHKQGVAFIVATFYAKQLIPELLNACEKLRPGISEKLLEPTPGEWLPKRSLTTEAIEMVNWVLLFPGQPYVIDESPSFDRNWQPNSRSTSCYCWLFESLNRGAFDFSDSEPLWRLLAQVGKGLGFLDEPTFTYIGAKRTWGERGMDYQDCIIVAPTSDQYDAIRIEETADGNCGIGPEEWIQEIKSLDEQFGVDIIAVYDLSAEIQLKRLPSAAELEELNSWFRRFAAGAFKQRGELQLDDLKRPIDLWCD